MAVADWQRSSGKQLDERREQAVWQWRDAVNGEKAGGAVECGRRASSCTNKRRLYSQTRVLPLGPVGGKGREVGGWAHNLQMMQRWEGDSTIRVQQLSQWGRHTPLSTAAQSLLLPSSSSSSSSSSALSLCTATSTRSEGNRGLEALARPTNTASRIER